MSTLKKKKPAEENLFRRALAITLEPDLYELYIDAINRGGKTEKILPDILRLQEIRNGNTIARSHAPQMEMVDLSVSKVITNQLITDIISMHEEGKTLLQISAETGVPMHKINQIIRESL